MGDSDHGAYCGNTSEDNDPKSKNQDSERPTDMLDMLSAPYKKQARNKGENTQATHTAEQMEGKRRAIEYIAAWFNEAVTEWTILAIDDSIEALKKSWALEGCSILVDLNVDDDGRRILNLAVHCSQGVSFLRSIELRSDIYEEAFVCQLVDSCIEEVGEKNVVQVVSNINSDMVAAKRPNIFWTSCAASSIDMMFEDIGHIPLIKRTIAKARSLTAFLYGETNLLDMMRRFTNQQDLVHAGITYYTTCCLNLKSLYDKRIELKTMFISKEWEDCKWSKEAVGKRFYNLVVSNEFWDMVLYVINSFEPVVGVLRRIASGRPYMGFIYGELENAKKEIAFRFENKEEHYLPIWNHIDFRINHYLKKPLHLAGYYLNPLFYHQNRNEVEKAEIFRDAVVECVHRMYQDQSMQEKIMNQLKLYRTGSQSFYTAHAIQAQMTVDPVVWWELHGGAARELSTMALRILRLTCGLSAYEPSWISMIHREKPSWIQHKKFKDSMYVTVNKRIQGKAQMRERDPLLAYLPREDEPFEWLVGMFHFDTQRPENRALLMARAKSSDEAGLAKLANKILNDADYVTSEEESDEEPPKQSSKKTTLSSASCTKRVKRQRVVKENIEDS